MSNYPEWLTGRYFGGAFVADTPGNEESAGSWPNGKSAPGAQECCDFLLEACNSSSPTDVPMLVFLIGGAGNGKSYLAKKVSNQLKGTRIDEKSTFARRRYDYRLANGGSLHVVNDATIPPKNCSGRRDYLVSDIASALDQGSSMLACVNRGILVSEANVAADGSDQSRHVSIELVRWLLSGHIKKDLGANDVLRLDVSDSPDNGGHYTFCRINSSVSTVAVVHVAFMDQCSLFEPFPEAVYRDQKITGPILLPELPQLTPICSPGRADSNLPGKEALSGLYERVAEDIDAIALPGGDLDPVKANIHCLSDPEVLNGVCNIIRAAEIITGNHINYRDVWGLSVVALIGPLPAGGLDEYEHWVADQAERVRTQDVTEQLKAITRLAMRRMHMTLFSTSGPAILLADSEQPTYPTVQAMESMALADPLVCLSEDAIQLIKDKLALLDEEKGPGKALAEQNQLFAKVWTRFDQRLEDAILAWLYATEEGLKFSERNQVLSWYGQYLARLFSVANGKPAYESLVNRWQEVWLRAARGLVKPTRALSDGLNRLLFTPFDEDRDETFLPVFSSRVTPVTSGQNCQGVALAIPTSQYYWEHHVFGSAIIMMLKKYTRPGTPISEFMLDFPMLREIDAQSAGGGFTEAAIDVEPRIERVRAGILAAEMQEAREGCARPEVVFVDGAIPIL